MGRRWRDYYDDYNPDREKALRKNDRLVDGYEKYKKEMCGGIGQRKVKLFLNKQIKDGDKVAELYRTALELENDNINAKKYNNTMRVAYKDRLYYHKELLIKELLSLCNEYNKSNEEKIVFGYQETNNYSTDWIVYFDLPEMEQISFHCNLKEEELKVYPKYDKEWDNKENSTLGKIESAIMKRYGELLEKIKN